MNGQQFFTIIWSRKGLIALCLVITVLTALVVSLLMPKQFIATTALVLDQRGIDQITGNVLPTQLMSGYMATQLDIISSHNVALKVVKHLKMDEDPQLIANFQKSNAGGDIRDAMADLLLSHLEVKPSRESSIIQINFSSIDPQFSALVANAFAQAYIQTSVDLRVQPAKLNADWFDDQLSALRKRMESAQEKLSAAQQKHGIVMTDDRLDLEDSRLATLARQLVESQAHTDELLSRKKQLVEALAGRMAFESLTEILNNPFVQSLKSELARTEAKFAELSERVDKNHPQYQQAQAEITSLRKKIKAEIRTVLNGVESSVASSKQHDDSLSFAIAEQKSKVLELKKQRDEIGVLKREVENAQRAYDAAMQRSVQTRMESEISQTNIAVLNSAIPPLKPAKPRILLNLLLSMVMGAVLGVGASLLAEMFDRRVRSANDIAESLGLPVIGVLANAERNKKSKWPVPFTRRKEAFT